MSTSSPHVYVYFIWIREVQIAPTFTSTFYGLGRRIENKQKSPPSKPSAGIMMQVLETQIITIATSNDSGARAPNLASYRD